MSLFRRLELPREHGAWGMLVVSALAGLITAGQPGEGSAWLVLALLAGFSSRESMVQTLRAWKRQRPAGISGRLALIKLSIMGLAGGVLLFRLGLWGLLWTALAAAILGALHLRDALAGNERSVSGQLVAILAITLAAPAADYVAHGSWRPQALAVWLLCVLYFASAVFYLKVRVGTVNRKRGRDLPRVRRQCAAYHAFLALLVLVLAVRTPLGPPLVLAYLAIVLRAAWFLVRPSQVLRLKRIGYLEVAYSLIFLAFLILAMRPL